MNGFSEHLQLRLRLLGFVKQLFDQFRGEHHLEATSAV
jgi:hypothetical protein